MKLPHEKPIRFAQEILEEKDDYKIISCIFPYVPTLSMVSEAAAQSSASFAQDDNSKPKIGFLISLKNISELIKPEDTEYKIKIEKSFNFGAMTEFLFELKKDEKVFVTGNLTIAIADEENK